MILKISLDFIFIHFVIYFIVEIGVQKTCIFIIKCVTTKFENPFFTLETVLFWHFNLWKLILPLAKSILLLLPCIGQPDNLEFYWDRVI